MFSLEVIAITIDGEMLFLHYLGSGRSKMGEVTEEYCWLLLR